MLPSVHFILVCDIKQLAPCAEAILKSPQSTEHGLGLSRARVIPHILFTYHE